jgi:hypothetical protein
VKTLAFVIAAVLVAAGVAGAAVVPHTPPAPESIPGFGTPSTPLGLFANTGKQPRVYTSLLHDVNPSPVMTAPISSLPTPTAMFGGASLVAALFSSRQRKL